MFSQSNLRIQLSSTNYYTNLDFVSGNLILNLINEEDVSAITVKLEGESRTRLMGIARRGNQNASNYETYQDRREKSEMEVHKVGIIVTFASYRFF